MSRAGRLRRLDEIEGGCVRVHVVLLYEGHDVGHGDPYYTEVESGIDLDLTCTDQTCTEPHVWVVTDDYLDSNMDGG